MACKNHKKPKLKPNSKLAKLAFKKGIKCDPEALVNLHIKHWNKEPIW